MFEDQNSVLGKAVFEEKPLPISDRDAKLKQLDSQIAEITNRIDALENSEIDAELRADITEINELLGDDELETEAQTITGAINELKNSETDTVIVNDTLTSTSATEALSARQGKILKDALDAHKAEVLSYSTVAAVSNVYTINFANSPIKNVKIETKDTNAKTVALANVPTGDAELFIELTYTNAAAITWFAGITWLSGTAPTFETGKVYRIALFKYGTGWHGNCVGGW